MYVPVAAAINSKVIESSSPRPRGWSRVPVALLGWGSRFPVPCVCGMAPTMPYSTSRSSTALRTRGDGPAVTDVLTEYHMCSPRQRGWFPSDGEGNGHDRCSPRPRAPVVGAVVDGEVGTIPASAGSGCGPSRRPAGRRDHPHERGEQCEIRGWGTAYWGLSPRARGTGAHAGSAYRRGGIIPTGAGSSWSCCAPSRRTKDHPRRHGKQSMRMLPAPMIAGPSPEARGAVEPHVALGRRSRDQSREHGEQWGKGVEEQNKWGPSPRARGAVHSALV